MFIIKHLPALQVLFPMMGALFSALSFNRIIAKNIAIITIAAGTLLSIISFCNNSLVVYAFGDWNAPIGIEYRLDFLNQPLIIFINMSLLFILVFGQRLIENTITSFINADRANLFYSILLFAHMGYIGMVSTNDLFNLYVFIEISSLSAYVLMAQGNNPKAVIGAFDYLILGSIGATFILIGIGFLLSFTGTLNITDIKYQIAGNYSSRIVITGSCFILVGTILKMAFFPIHFWMVRAYSSATAIILAYLASISGIIGIYVVLRFIHFALDYDQIICQLSLILRPVALITIIICSYFAVQAKNLRKIIIYSTASQIGYIVLLLSIPNSQDLIFRFLLVDGINKISLFFIIAQKEETNFVNNNFLKNFVIITLICSAGIPLSSMFILKMNILEMLIRRDLLLEFIVIILSSAIALVYHYKLAKCIFSNRKSSLIMSCDLNWEILGMMLLITLQISTLFSQNWLKKHNIWHPENFISSSTKYIVK